MNKITTILVLLVGCVGSGTLDSSAVEEATTFIPPPSCDYPQVHGNAAHTGTACPDITNMTVLASLPQDDDAQAITDTFGFLQIHEGPPLTSGDFLLVPGHHGFADPFDRSTDRWRIAAYRWVPSVSDPLAHLEPSWTVESDWSPVDAIRSLGGWTNGYVQQFAPAILGKVIYAPSASGRIARLDLGTGALISTVDPFAGTSFDGDPRVTVNSAVSFTQDGSAYYTAVAWPTTAVPSKSEQPRGAWLVHIRPDLTTRLVPWTQIASSTVGVPQLADLCEYAFGVGGTPAATGPDSRPPLFKCGTQRPAMNAPVAVDPGNGHLVVFTYANNAQGAAFLVDVDPVTLQPTRAYDTRGHALHGCGVRLAGTFEGDSGTTCDTVTAGGTTNLGVDPDFNGPVRFRGEDLMKIAPVVAPNGDISIGSYDGGFVFGGDFDARGFGMVFKRDGSGLRALNTTHWWDATPSVWQHAGTFSYLKDQQVYSDFQLHADRLSPTMVVEAQGNLNSAPTDSSDFRDANIVFGPSGNYYAFAGDGFLYKYSASGATLESIPLPDADGNPNTMITLAGHFARDRGNHVITSQAGRVYVVGSNPAGTIPPGPPRKFSATTRPRAHVLRGLGK